MYLFDLIQKHYLELLTDDAVQETEAAQEEACRETTESVMTRLDIFQQKLDAYHEGLMLLEGMKPTQGQLTLSKSSL